jgi:hypothetical protein
VLAVAGGIKLWLDGRGTTQYGMLTDVEYSKFSMSRAMPDIRLILRFKDLAIIMIKIAPSLKLSHATTYDALILVHKTYNNLLGTNIFKSARSFSPLLRKPLLWYRALAMYQDKRSCVFKMSDECHVKAVLEITDAVERDGSDCEAESGFDTTPRNRKPVTFADEKPSAFSSKSSDAWFGKDDKFTTPMQSPRDIRVHTASSSKTSDSWVGWGGRSDASYELDTDSWFDRGDRSNASDELEKCFSELESLADAPQQPALTRRSSWAPQQPTLTRRSSWNLKTKIVASWDLKPTIVKSESTSHFDGCLDMLCKGAEASSSAIVQYKPLSGTSGNIQRKLTMAYKKDGACKPARKAATPKVASAGKGKTAAASRVGTISYETKKRKCNASKMAAKVALEAGATKEESLAAGRRAYADCP